MKTNQFNGRVSSGAALLPFLLFIVVFLGSGIIMSLQGVEKPFSQFASLAAVYIALIAAFLFYRGKVSEKLNLLLGGISRNNACWLFQRGVFEGSYISRVFPAPNKVLINIAKKRRYEMLIN